MAYAFNPRLWLVVVVLFTLALALRLWRQWRDRWRAARAARRAQGTKRP